MSDAHFDPECELCEAARFTHWYHEDDVCWVADCEACSTPMVVWKRHGTEPNAADIDHMLERLRRAGDERFGPGEHNVDRIMRQVPSHFHAHTRDNAWLERRWTSPMSLYTGVGGAREVRA